MYQHGGDALPSVLQVNYVVQEAIVVIKDIFRKYPNKYESIISTLCENLDTLDEPEARWVFFLLLLVHGFTAEHLFLSPLVLCIWLWKAFMSSLTSSLSLLCGHPLFLLPGCSFLICPAPDYFA